MKCCGENRVTPFCPICGRKMLDPLAELLVHVRQKGKRYRVSFECLKECIAEDPTRRLKHGEMQRAEALAKKWERWAEALVSAIELEGNVNG